MYDILYDNIIMSDRISSCTKYVCMNNVCNREELVLRRGCRGNNRREEQRREEG
jgi:hypothetical protein